MSKTAVVVIDVQEGILSGISGARAEEAEKALDAMVWRIHDLLKRARVAQVPVIYVQHEGEIGHRLEPGSAGYPIREEISMKRGDFLIHTKYCDSFHETALQSALEKLAVDHLIICGCMTQYCVDTSVRRAVSLGYNVTLVKDGHMTADFGGLTFQQIIFHHNRLLDGFDAGAHAVKVVEAAEIQFGN
ncbi:MAG TPA: isochorismatase family protein [Candidatus Koribacter sp.]|jgi:nicotinamidase-related amidase